MIVSAKLVMALLVSLLILIGLNAITICIPLTVAQPSGACPAASSSPPIIQNFNFSPKELILDNVSTQIELVTQVADEGNDIESIEVVFSSPSENQSIGAFMNSTNLLSGDARNGSYCTNLSFSPTSEEGAWTLDHMMVCDIAGDCKKINASSAEMLGFPANMQIARRAEPGNMTSSQVSQASRDRVSALHLGLDSNELRGWASTDKRFFAQRKIIINSVFNRPSICWP
ncbi:MAG: hypothetical protein PHQ34_13465 [Methanothrix sp.]|nr:hypothetical protein [Methanothrix sp.]